MNNIKNGVVRVELGGESRGLLALLRLSSSSHPGSCDTARGPVHTLATRPAARTGNSGDGWREGEKQTLQNVVHVGEECGVAAPRVTGSARGSRHGHGAGTRGKAIR